ncbi:MAG TPA: VF530 family protein [Candidatus Paceibacterota bacterium]|nr:VF530 family protein [Candidatus Paceibacterota bacterium]
MIPQRNNPLHGITLKSIVEELAAYYGWEELGKKIKIRCFTENPSVNSSLTFLRKTPWAREKVEKYYIWTFFKRDGTRKQ